MKSVRAANPAEGFFYRQVDQVAVKDLLGLRRLGETLRRSDSGRKLAEQSGAYLSPLQGRGMEFAESRPYQAGDDVRHLDWRVLARSGKAHSKIFQEERERPVLFWLDLRRPMRFATRGAFKSVVAAYAAALLAWQAHARGDRVGALLFSDTRHAELKPQRGHLAVLRLLHSLEIFTREQAADLATPSLLAALLRLRQVARPGSLVYLLSDFHDLDSKAETQIRRLIQHQTLVLIHIFDPLEQSLPPPGVYGVSDGREQLVFDSGAKALRKRYEAQFADRLQRLQNLAQTRPASLLNCPTDADLPHLLRRALK